MARQVFQVHLSADGCSKRAVRFRVLTPSEKDALLVKAASIIATNNEVAQLQGAAAGMSLKLVENREAVKAMLVSVTDPVAEADIPTAKFKPVTLADLSMPGAMQYDFDGTTGLFNAKDDEVLSATYRHYHAVAQKEIEAIVGKAVPVSED